MSTSAHVLDADYAKRSSLSAFTRIPAGWLSLTVMLLFAVSITTSMFFKEKWLWMDEVLSYILVSDRSLAHMNNAIVSGMDANPPLFANLYWLIGHYISLDTVFLRAVSVVLFAVSLGLFYRYVTRLIGTPVVNFMLITVLAAFTYLNFTLSAQIRAYPLFLLIGYLYFTVIHRLVESPGSGRLLVLHVVTGVLLALTHNFGLFYLAAAGAFVGLLWLWSRDNRYWFVLGSYGVILALWLLIWYPNFVIQTKAGIPHSWIPVPRFLSFFRTVGELAPTLAARIEYSQSFTMLVLLRFVGLVSLAIYIARPRLKQGFEAVRRDRAFLFYLMAAFVYVTTILIALGVSLVHTSVFISRYMWPSHLLVIYQLVYAFYYFANGRYAGLASRYVPKAVRLLPVYIVVLTGFLFYQSWKIAIFPTGLLAYVPKLDKRYPVFVESAVHFLPLWFYKDKNQQIVHLLDRHTAFAKNNLLGATVQYHIMASLKEKYNMNAIIQPDELNPQNVPHFYVVNESHHYQMEHVLNRKGVKIIRRMPTYSPEFTILECVF